MFLTDVYASIQAAIQPSLLVAVSKTKPIEALQIAYEQANCRDFGENKVQEMLEKYAALPKDIRWHMIGHLQSNKIKYIAPFIHLIHSVDSFKLLEEINTQALKYNRVIECLLEIYIASEESKFGFSFEEAELLLQDKKLESLQNIRLVGLMGMASFSKYSEVIRKEFKGLAAFFKKCQVNYHNPQIDFRELSMGMSGDYRIAIEEGSTMIRLGSSLFGSR